MNSSLCSIAPLSLPSNHFDREAVNMPDMPTLQKRMQEVLKASGVGSAAELARQIGESRQLVQTWVKGPTQLMSAGAAFAIQDRVLPKAGGRFSARYILTGEGGLLMKRYEETQDVNEDSLRLAMEWQKLPFRLRAAIAGLIDEVNRERLDLADRPRRRLPATES